MRFAVLSLVLALVGCLATQEPHNPTKRPEDASTAPVKSSADAAPAEAPESAPLPTLTRVQTMKRLFLQRKAAAEAVEALQARFMSLAEGMTSEELAELNDFLKQHGVQLHRKCQNPNHNHDENNPDDKKEDEQGQQDENRSREVF